MRTATGSGLTSARVGVPRAELDRRIAKLVARSGRDNGIKTYYRCPLCSLGHPRNDCPRPLIEAVGLTAAVKQLYGQGLSMQTIGERLGLSRHRVAATLNGTARRSGRRPLPAATRRRVLELTAIGHSTREVARELGIGLGTVANIIAERQEALQAAIAAHQGGRDVREQDAAAYHRNGNGSRSATGAPSASGAPNAAP